MCDTIPCQNIPIALQNYGVAFYPLSDGLVRWATVIANTSFVQESRVWNIKIAGYLTPITTPTYQIILFLEKIQSPIGEITFEGPVDGILTLGQKCVFNATSIVSYTFDEQNKTISLFIKLSRPLTRQKQFEINIDINDHGCHCHCVEETSENTFCVSPYAIKSGGGACFFQCPDITTVGCCSSDDNDCAQCVNTRGRPLCKDFGCGLCGASSQQC
jgi:hypothetical protein